MTAFLKAFWLSILFFRAAALTVATPTLNVKTRIASSKPAAQAFRHSSKYLDVLGKSGLANPLKRAIQGQIRVWDMVALFAACGLVQAYRFWRQRSKEGVPRDGRASQSPDKPRISGERGSEACKRCWENTFLTVSQPLTSPFRSNCRRSWSPQETFNFEVVPDLSRYL